MARGDFPSAKQDQFVVRFPDGMRETLRKAAEANDRSMNAEIIARLTQTFAGGALTDGERREYQRRINVLLDQEARARDQLGEALNALKRNDLATVERILKPHAWYERNRADFVNANEGGAGDERS